MGCLIPTFTHSLTMNTLHSLFAQKAWANNELYNALAAVTDEQHAAAVHMATRTLNHIYVVDRIFRAHLLGEPHGYTATNTDATPELGELQFAVAETDGWFVVRGRHEQALPRRHADSEHGGRVEVREEDQDVVLMVLALQVLDQSR